MSALAFTIVLIGFVLLLGRARIAFALTKGILGGVALGLLVYTFLGEGPGRTFALPAALVAGIGIMLRWLGARWATWLLIPFAVLVSLSIATHLSPLAPLGVVGVLALAAPFVLAVIALKSLQGIVTGLFGRAVASRVVASEILRLLGGPGRGRIRQHAEPELPRPRRPFDPWDREGRR